MKTHSGSCLCGEVRFQITGDFQRFYLCHCGHCRKGSGSAHAANLFSSTATIDWLCGGDTVRVYKLPGTRHARCFCALCGSSVPYVNSDATVLMVPAGCLETPLSIRPDAHIHIASRADWDRDLASIPTFDGPPG